MDASRSRRRLRPRLTYANVVATLALFVALGGVTYAQTIGRNTVGAAQLKPNSVGTSELQSHAVGATELRPGAVGLAALAAAARQGVADMPSPPNGNAGGALAGTYPHPTLAPMVWHEVADPGAMDPHNTEPKFQNGWNNFSSNLSSGAFAKDGFGIVHLKGFLAGTTSSTVVFTLPAGYRPARRLYVLVDTDSNSDFLTNGGGHESIPDGREISVDTDGSVTALGSSSIDVSLDSITFPAA